MARNTPSAWKTRPETPFRILRPVSAPQCADKPNYLPAEFQAPVDKSIIEQWQIKAFVAMKT